MTASPTELKIHDALSTQRTVFDLVDPEQAPPEIHKEVMYGFHILIHTPHLLPENVGGTLSCTNCHFSAGNTLGGKGGSISLAGIAALYPSYNQRSKEILTLEERVNNCFERSLNGKPLNFDSKEMKAIITYLHWISLDFPIYRPLPWRGLKPLKATREPNLANGEKIYFANCANCHGKEGEGKIRVPAIWGENSFNDGAGLNQLETLSAFIYANMPYKNESLSPEEALDVAAFLKKQPRPHFEIPRDK